MLVRAITAVVIDVDHVNDAPMLEQGVRSHHRPRRQQNQRNYVPHATHAGIMP